MIRTHFNKIENEINSSINSSQRRIYIAVAWFTNQYLFESLLNAAQRKVEIKLILLNDILNRNEFGLEFGLLANNGADIRFAVSNFGTMHNKFCIIDNVVISGSYNWTYHANKNNENVIVTDEDDIVNSYCKEFERLFNEGAPLSLPYEHLKWTEIKEGDFSELRRNIFRDVIAKNDENRELKRSKLINLDHAYKSGNTNELEKASSLPITGKMRTITEVLTAKSRDYEFRLWEENITGKPLDNVEGYVRVENWFFVPLEIKEDKYHQLCVEGSLKVYCSKDDIWSRGLKLKVYDIKFIEVIKTYWGTSTTGDYKLIPAKILTIEGAKLFFYHFSTPLYNKSQSRTWKSTEPRIIPSINIFGIVKESDGNILTFYEGWDPQKRGDKIMKEFFVKEL